MILVRIRSISGHEHRAGSRKFVFPLLRDTLIVLIGVRHTFIYTLECSRRTFNRRRIQRHLSGVIKCFNLQCLLVSMMAQRSFRVVSLPCRRIHKKVSTKGNRSRVRHVLHYFSGDALILTSKQTSRRWARYSAPSLCSLLSRRNPRFRPRLSLSCRHTKAAGSVPNCIRALSETKPRVGAMRSGMVLSK